MLKPFAKSLIVLAILSVATSGCARSQNPGWTNYEDKNTYLENSRETQNQQWAGEDWYVQDWLSQEKNPSKLIEKFYRNDIIREERETKGAPVLYVGPQFYRLGGFDKRRVLTTIDTVSGYTAANKVITLKDWYTKRIIGVFTRDGLQIE